ncbi:BQ5605_C006g04165 [Microbotryum silenes-dioicae]|uniref:BQ5605_C006g04165 protein n=1 Tax=Microbotryum silenes-dioicae TaxID=796604 RepID=A0A2X0M959_9BASI|nr:BQ5605_C006g04165 [Microbotryum silenes-dioicae]
MLRHTRVVSPGERGGGGMLPFSGGEAVAKDSLEAGLVLRHRAQLVPNDT